MLSWFGTSRRSNRDWAISVVNEISKTSLYATRDVRIDSLEGCYKNHADYFDDFVSLSFWDDLEPHVVKMGKIAPSGPRGLVTWPFPDVKKSDFIELSRQITKFSEEIRMGLSKRLDDEVNISISTEHRRTRAEVMSFQGGAFASCCQVQADRYFVDVAAFALARRSFARLSGIRSPENSIDALAQILDRDAEPTVRSGLKGSFVWGDRAWASIERELSRALCRDRLSEGNFFGVSEIGKQKFSKGVDLVPKKKFLGRIDDQALQVSSHCCPVLDGVYEGALLSAAEGLRMGIGSIPGGRLDSMGRIYYPDSCFRLRIPVCPELVLGRRTINLCEVRMVDWGSLVGDLIVHWDDGSCVHAAEARVSLPRLVSMSNRIQRGVVMTHDIEQAISGDHSPAPYE
ncbi:MAG: hypothetical protein ACFN04_02870 [Propionibacterium acidifaciens]